MVYVSLSNMAEMESTPTPEKQVFGFRIFRPRVHRPKCLHSLSPRPRVCSPCVQGKPVHSPNVWPKMRCNSFPLPTTIMSSGFPNVQNTNLCYLSLRWTKTHIKHPTPTITVFLLYISFFSFLKEGLTTFFQREKVALTSLEIAI